MFRVHTSSFFDTKVRVWRRNATLIVDPRRGTITDIVTANGHTQVVIRPGDIDLRGKFVMPGLVDSHTHIFLHSYSERSATSQMRDESAVERTVRATAHARTALMAGYTTYRDLGTEALRSADVGLRNCIARGIVPGPRLFVATEAVASSGSYEVRVESADAGLVVPRASDVGDGTAGVTAAVRRRAGDGADVLKFYADYRRQTTRFPSGMLFPPNVRAPPDATPGAAALPLFSQAEMEAIVAEAHRAHLPVAAHAGEARTAVAALKAGVNTVEHVHTDTYGGPAFREMADFVQKLRLMEAIWVPTLAVTEALRSPESLAWQQRWVRAAFEHGAMVAAGGDTGAFSHGLNARELELMLEAGVGLEDVLVAATYNGWQACGGVLSGYRFGWFEADTCADIIALETDPSTDPRAFRKVSFVMKDGHVYKQDGVPVPVNMEPTPPRWPDDAGSPRTSGHYELVELVELGDLMIDMGTNGSPRSNESRPCRMAPLRR